MPRNCKCHQRSLTDDEAHAVLSPMWDRIAATYVEYGFVEPAKCRIEINSSAHDSCRHFAATRIDGKLMIVAPELADMPLDTAEAILAHEAGHVVDLSNPGHWWFVRGELLMIEELPAKNLKKLMARWEKRSDDEIERVADAIAELVMGRRIGYIGDRSCLVQTWDAGISRPRGLR